MNKMAGLAVYHVASTELTDQVNSSGKSPIPTENRTVMRAIRGFRQTLHVRKETVKTIEHKAAPVHAMTSYKTRDEQLHSFFTSALGEEVNFAPRPLYPRRPMAIISRWAPEPVSTFWKETKTSWPSLQAIRTPDRPARSLVAIQLLHRGLIWRV